MDGTITIGAKIETKQFDKQIEDMERKIADLENQLKLKGTGVLDERQIHDVEVELEKSKNQLAGLYQQKAKLDASGNGRGFGNLADGLRDAVKHAGRLVLSVFGIRSAYLALRRASSDLASYDAQYGANLEYIRYALTQMIAPALQWIIGLAKNVLGLINYIANALFGVNLFSRASADNFKKMKSGIGGANTEAKKLQKTLAGFDEMNILNSSSTGGGGGVGGVGGIGPDFDLSDLEDYKPPEWIEKIVKFLKDNKDFIIDAIKKIATAFLIFKTLQIAGLIDPIINIMSALGRVVINTLQSMVASIGKFRTTIVALGAFVFITGLINSIINLIALIKNPSWENFRKLIASIGTAMIGLGAVMTALNASNPVGWVILAIGAVTSLISLIISLTQETQSLGKAINAEAEETRNLAHKRELLMEVTNKYINAVDRAEESEKALRQAEKEAGITIEELIKKMRNENLSYADLDPKQRKVYKNYLSNVQAQKELEETTENLKRQTEGAGEQFYRFTDVLMRSSKSADEYRDKLLTLYSEGKTNAEETARALGIAMADMDEKTKRVFVQNIPEEIKKCLNPLQYQVDATNMKNWWNNSMIGSLNTKINLKFGFTNLSTVQNTINRLKSAVGFRTGGLVKLASGGVVNMPNRGVPLASAIAGESGREGIIPLTDSGAMQELGKEIGKWITINASITNNMNGRVISRELRSIQNDQNFAYNT